MNIKLAIVERIKSLCSQRGLAVNSLANLSGITPSTLYSILDSERKDIGIVTIKKICDGFGITITEFFDTDIFRNLEQEIR